MPMTPDHVRSWLLGLPGAFLESDDVIAIRNPSFPDSHDRRIGVRIDATGCEILLPTVTWASSYTPVAGWTLWRSAAWIELPDRSKLLTFVRAGRRARQRQFTPCRFCGESYPTEFRAERNLCHGCAQIHCGHLF